MYEYETSDIRKNLKVQIDGEPYIVVDFQFVKPGKGNAFTRTKLKNMKTGSVIERTYKSGEKLTPANLEEHQMQFLYKEGEDYHFMNTQSYEQTFLTEEQIGEAKDYLIENLVVSILYFNQEAIGVNLPNFIDFEVIETEPGFKGDTATSGTKPAKVITGATFQVPLFLEQGDVIKIDTRTGEYVERVRR